MYDHRTYLKVKIKSLAAEAQIIRKEERKNPKLREGLSEHRKGVVRRASRETLLAYGFLRGKKYEEIEKTSRTQPNWSNVGKMVLKYGCIRCWEQESFSEFQERNETLMKRFEEWHPSGK